MENTIQFKRDPLGYLRIILPNKIEYFSDFLEDIVTISEADEYLSAVKNVLDGMIDEFEIELNSTIVYIKRDVTVIEHFYTNNDENKNSLDTERFRELIELWKSKIPERYKDQE